MLQVSSGAYNKDVNLALLKLYQFDPSRMNVGLVSSVLALALQHIADGDFQLCLYLLVDLAPFEAFVQLADLLELGRFAEFWTARSGASPAKPAIDAVRGFDECIRGFIMSLVEATFQSIAREELCGMLNAKGDAVLKLCRERGWGVDDATTLRPPLNEFNQAKEREIKEEISFEQLAPFVFSRQL